MTPVFPKIISTADGLTRLVEQVAAEQLLACDLEGDSLHHYQERVCLIQISTPSESFLIDPLAIPDLSPLAPVMTDPAIRKVFHGADYDIRSLHRDFGIEVTNLFDTMVACQILGEKEVGLAAVLKKRFGVELDKRYQKADWSKRPLSQGMIEYAARDTTLLIELYGQLHRELVDKGRLAWLEEECELLSRVRSAVRATGPLYLKFKGAARMDQRTLAVLEELLRFREEKARLRDVPPFKVLGNEQLRAIAEKRPRKLGDMKEIQGMASTIVERYGRLLLEAVERGMALPPDRLPTFPRSPRVPRNARQEQCLKALKQWREEKARKLRVDGGLLANNSLLELLAESAPQSIEDLSQVPMLKRWQREVFGAELLDVLQS